MEASCVAMDKTLVILKVQTKKEDTVKDNRIIAKTTEEIVSTAKTSISQALIKSIIILGTNRLAALTTSSLLLHFV